MDFTNAHQMENLLKQALKDIDKKMEEAIRSQFTPRYNGIIDEQFILINEFELHRTKHGTFPNVVETFFITRGGERITPVMGINFTAKF